MARAKARAKDARPFTDRDARREQLAPFMFGTQQSGAPLLCTPGGAYYTPVAYLALDDYCWRCVGECRGHCEPCVPDYGTQTERNVDDPA